MAKDLTVCKFHRPIHHAQVNSSATNIQAACDGNDEELGITRQVDEEDMPDLEPEILIRILSHDLPSRYL
jgi:hypothetical protein